MTQYNQTREKLKGTPFDSAEELKDAQKRIQYEVWHDLERSKAIRTLSENAEYQFLFEIFEEPWRCYLKAGQSEVLSVELTKKMTPKMVVNESLMKGGSTKEFIEAISSAMLGGLVDAYLQVFQLKGAQRNVAQPPEKK